MSSAPQEPTVIGPAVAGSFYPQEAGPLRDQVAQFLAGSPDGSLQPRAVIAPHAGYAFSGPVAGSVFRELQGRSIRRVVLMGPTHHFRFDGLAVPRASHMQTPLGMVPVDSGAMQALAGLPEVIRNDQPFGPEHALEVELPFLQHILEDFSVVPILTGRTDPLLAGEALARLWGGPETLILVSSDLSHYLDYAQCCQIDRTTGQAINLLRSDVITSNNACGHIAVNALLQRARELGMRVTPLDIRNSGDTQGGRDRVVGYGGWCFEEASTVRLGPEHRRSLLKATAQGIAAYLQLGRVPQVDTGLFPVPLRALRNVFVTVTKEGQLRGCIGSMAPHRPLVEDVVANGCKACFSDPRFPPLTEPEIGELEISISILGPLRPISAGSEHELLAGLQPDRDGLMIRAEDKGATFLPHVWHSLPNPVMFLRRLKAKAGLHPEHWPETLQAWRYSTEEFSAPLAGVLEEAGAGKS